MLRSDDSSENCGLKSPPVIIVDGHPHFRSADRAHSSTKFLRVPRICICQARFASLHRRRLMCNRTASHPACTWRMRRITPSHMCTFVPEVVNASRRYTGVLWNLHHLHLSFMTVNTIRPYNGCLYWTECPCYGWSLTQPVGVCERA